MTYDTRWLDKIESYSDYDEDTRRILLLLCHRRWEWRTARRLAQGSKLPPERVNMVLDELREQGVVVMSLSKNKRVIYGITNRVRG